MNCIWHLSIHTNIHTYIGSILRVTYELSQSYYIIIISSSSTFSFSFIHAFIQSVSQSTKWWVWSWGNALFICDEIKKKKYIKSKNTKNRAKTKCWYVLKCPVIHVEQGKYRTRHWNSTNTFKSIWIEGRQRHFSGVTLSEKM